MQHALRHTLEVHTQECKQDIDSFFRRVTIDSQLLPVCQWICLWNGVPTCSHILSEYKYQFQFKMMNGAIENSDAFLKLIGQLHLLGIDPSILLSWMEQYLLLYNEGHTADTNTISTRTHIYLQTFCLHRLQSSPFLQQLLCLTHQWQKTAPRISFETAPNPTFDLTEGLGVLLLYLELSKPTGESAVYESLPTENEKKDNENENEKEKKP